MDITELRNEIDAVDGELVELFRKRMEVQFGGRIGGNGDHRFLYNGRAIAHRIFPDQFTVGTQKR